MDPADKSSKAKRLICLCNAIPQADIEAAIARGCTTLGKIFDATTAGVGACGGSCQPILKKMLAEYLEKGRFPEDPRPKDRKRKAPR
jgi:bacterioferritin-associated ferredoxin